MLAQKKQVSPKRAQDNPPESAKKAQKAPLGPQENPQESPRTSQDAASITLRPHSIYITSSKLHYITAATCNHITLATLAHNRIILNQECIAKLRARTVSCLKITARSRPCCDTRIGGCPVFISRCLHARSYCLCEVFQNLIIAADLPYARNRLKAGVI